MCKFRPQAMDLAKAIAAGKGSSKAEAKPDPSSGGRY
jgi:hypothetical protein